MVAFGLALAAAVSVASPSGTVKVRVDAAGGQPYGTVVLGETSVAAALGPDFGSGYAVVSQSVRSVRSGWRPVWGTQAEYPDRYDELVTVFSGTNEWGGSIGLRLEARAYDEGVAFRWTLPPSAYSLCDVPRERTALRFPRGTVAWAISATEETYPERPIPLENLSVGRACRLPLTLELPAGGCASILEADVRHAPRAHVERAADGALRTVFDKGSQTGRRTLVSPWRVILYGRSAAALVDAAPLIRTLNAPCAIADTGWIRPGLSVSDLGNCPLETERIIACADAAKEAGARYFQLDWGWYGTEYAWTDEDRADFRTYQPGIAAANPSWEANTRADPRRAADGYVPYHPRRYIQFSRGNVSLDIPRIVAGLKDRGLGLCLYIHGLPLEENDLDELFATYEAWGVAGLKPGFVSYGSQAATEFLRRMVEAAARHHLWLDIHDLHVPDGMERTWPNLLLSEGGGGEEGHHPPRQDVSLPFARCLAGPFDYTPKFFGATRTETHPAAMLLAYPGSAAVLRGNIAKALAEAPDVFRFVRALPWTYDRSMTLDAVIGRRIVVARRKDGVWYLSGLSGACAESVEIDLGFIDDAGEWTLEGVRDDGRKAAAFTRRVRKGDRLPVVMEAGGGFCGILRRTEEK